MEKSGHEEHEYLEHETWKAGDLITNDRKLTKYTERWQGEWKHMGNTAEMNMTPQVKLNTLNREHETVKTKKKT